MFLCHALRGRGHCPHYPYQGISSDLSPHPKNTKMNHTEYQKLRAERSLQDIQSNIAQLKNLVRISSSLLRDRHLLDLPMWVLCISAYTQRGKPLAEGAGVKKRQALGGCFGKFIQTKKTFRSHATLCSGHQRETKIAPISLWPSDGSQDPEVGGKGPAPPFCQVPMLVLSAQRIGVRKAREVALWFWERKGLCSFPTLLSCKVQPSPY